MYVLVWMYNEFLFFYKKSLINNLYGDSREKSSLGHFCHHFLYIKGNGKEGKIYI